MIPNQAHYKLRLQVDGSLRAVDVEARVSEHRHGVVLIRCADQIGRWQTAVDAGIEDAKWTLHRRNLLPLEIEVLAFRGTDETSDKAARLATCVAIVRAAEDSQSWPKVICEDDDLRIVWGPGRRP